MTQRERIIEAKQDTERRIRDALMRFTEETGLVASVILSEYYSETIIRCPGVAGTERVPAYYVVKISARL